MANEKQVFGYIDCPTCGYEKGMRITADKHGAPFGFCEANCDGQLRIGGKPRRVAAFFAKYPHIANAMQEKPAVTVTEEKPEPEPENPAVSAEEKPPVPAKKKGFGTSFDMGAL